MLLKLRDKITFDKHTLLRINATFVVNTITK